MRLITPSFTSVELSKVKPTVLELAKISIINYQFKSTEVILDKYIRDTYKIGLRQLCIKIIKRTQIAKNSTDKQYSIVFIDPEDRKIAQLITYGNLSMRGSNILRDSFNI